MEPTSFSSHQDVTWADVHLLIRAHTCLLMPFQGLSECCDTIQDVDGELDAMEESHHIDMSLIASHGLNRSGARGCPDASLTGPLTSRLSGRLSSTDGAYFPSISPPSHLVYSIACCTIEFPTTLYGLDLTPMR